jgi:HPt (histidine-containing phosphotransfer) domain-containing protein
MITDLNYLRTMSGGDDEFILEMINLFREQVDEYKEVMPRLLSNKDYDGLSKLAHKAKSSMAVMGMKQVADILKDLEILAHEAKEVERYEALVQSFLDQSQQAIEELEGFNKEQ